MLTARPYTEQLHEMIDEGIVDKDQIIACFTSYMSEQDVKDMMFSEEILPIEFDDEDEDNNDDDDSFDGAAGGMRAVFGDDVPPLDEEEEELDWNNPASPAHY